MTQRILRPFAVASALALAALLVAPAAHAQDTADAVNALRNELGTLRTQLAQTQLELQRALGELKELRAFQQTPDAAKQVEQWRVERERIAEERKRLALERRRLDQARLTLRSATTNSSPRPVPGRAPAAGGNAAPAPPAAADAPADGQLGEQPRWELDYKIGVIHTGGNYQKTYVDPTVGAALVKSYPLIDRRHIMVRGTLQNRSGQPWRYTFEVRIGGREGGIIGRWRHQTVTLGPNEMAAFELKVPVTDVGSITTYQIGNIEADRPAPAAPAVPAPPAPRERERVNR